MNTTEENHGLHVPDFLKNCQQTPPTWFAKLGIPTWLEFQSGFTDILPPVQIVRIYEQVVSLAIWDWLKKNKPDLCSCLDRCEWPEVDGGTNVWD